MELLEIVENFNDWIHYDAEEERQMLESLPDKVKDMIFTIFRNSLEVNEHSFCLGQIKSVYDACYWCESPIEKIYLAADYFYRMMADIYEMYYIIPQHEIEINDKTYRVDFLYCLKYADDDRLNIIVECDGHDYHTSKEQVKRDNERQMALRLAGYEVIRFSGSQIYENPFKCVHQVYKFIESKLRTPPMKSLV